MDTTLVTFMVQTPSSMQSVHLIGSWDNFQKRYPMEHDLRRGKSHWRGCYTFEDIICDGDGKHSKRNGGLKMGSKYYYYYELNGSVEYCDVSTLYTTSCPYLPGQPVNFLWVPIEVLPLRNRSASMSSIATSNMKTINPSQKALKPPKLPLSDIPPRGYTSRSAVISGKDSAQSMPSKSDKSLWSLYGLIPEKRNLNRQDVVSSLHHTNNPVKSKYTRSLTPNVTKASASASASATVTDEPYTLSTASPISRLPLAQIQSKNMKSKQLCLGPGSSPQTENSTCETGTSDTKISNISISSKKKLSRTPIHYPACRKQLRQVGDSDQNKDNVVDSARPAPISSEILSKNNHCYLLQSEASSIKSIFQKPSSFFTMIPKPHQSSSKIISRPPNIEAEMENLNAFESFKLDMGYLGNLIVV